ncbi:MAG TPA: hypothetical protein VE360_07545 [Pyrinomonadaceae bacterium]|nr:hypothetical protein [Pyrinomonadaceae bacterium]
MREQEKRVLLAAFSKSARAPVRGLAPEPKSRLSPLPDPPGTGFFWLKPGQGSHPPRRIADFGFWINCPPQVERPTLSFKLAKHANPKSEI